MRTRRVVAALLLAMLPAFAGASMIAHEPVAGRTVEWVYALGMTKEEALVVGVVGAVMCGAIAFPGGIACGLVGAA